MNSSKVLTYFITGFFFASLVLFIVVWIIKDKFALGNFVRVGVRSDYIKRARLLEINMSFDDLSDFSATFGNLITTKSEIDKHADLMKQAVQAGKSVASNASNW